MTKTYKGSCHCGAVRYQAELDLSVVSRCNCSICTKVGRMGVMIKPPAFRLLSGEESVTRYYPRKQEVDAYYAFCSRCGIHCYGMGNIPELGGEFVGVNANTIDETELVGLKTVHYDGRHDNWQAGPRDTPWPIMA